VNSDDVIAQIGGGLWRAKSAEPLTPAALVDVLALEGLTLRVRPRLHALAHR
jgi:membrane protein implicated in regulation of membrane protease activity